MHCSYLFLWLLLFRICDINPNERPHMHIEMGLLSRHTFNFEVLTNCFARRFGVEKFKEKLLSYLQIRIFDSHSEYDC